MASKGEYRSYYKNIIAILFILFALSPCAVKESFLSQLGIEYYKPLNKVRISSPGIVGCSVTIKVAESKTAVIKVPCKLVPGIPPEIAYRVIFSPAGKKLFNTYTSAATGNSPPQYILFKRLKLHLV